MVFHITNYMRETNVWMIRKMRWIFWSIALAVPISRHAYWDYHGKRTAWKLYLFDRRTEKQKLEDAEKKKADWGFHPRFQPQYWFSLKKRKYDAQTAQEKRKDLPRIFTRTTKQAGRGDIPSEDIRTSIFLLMEHNRKPGAFDYEQPQNFYSLHPEIDHDSWVMLGDNKTHGKLALPFHYQNTPPEAKRDY